MKQFEITFKNITLAIFMVVAVWTTSSHAQFHNEIVSNILMAVGESKSTISNEQLLLIVQDSVDSAVKGVVSREGKSGLALFLRQANFITQNKYEELIDFFSCQSKECLEYADRAAAEVKGYFVPKNTERLMSELNLQTVTAIKNAYIVGKDKSALESINNVPSSSTKKMNVTQILQLMKDEDFGDSFAYVANEYLDESVNNNFYRSGVDLSLKRMPHRPLVPKKSVDKSDEFMTAFRKIFTFR